MTSIILAGGKSSRLGRNKALQVIDGRSLIQWIVNSLSIFSTEIIIVTATGEAIPCYSTVEVRTVATFILKKVRWWVFTRVCFPRPVHGL